jgi:predicted methyltransferase
MGKLAVWLISCSLVVSGAALSRESDSPKPSKEVTAAVADSTRPSTDTERDANRKPLETLAFVGVKPGDKVADYAAGSGYFTRLFSDIVQPAGHVYAVVPGALYQYPNIGFPEKLDVFWIAQNYHDLHDSCMGPVDMAVFNKAVFDALKPGGIYIVLDHSAAQGAPADVTDTLHRIDPQTVRHEVESAGFVFKGESAILANPADPRTTGVFDKSIRGRTDQFILKFQKPPR